MEAIGKDLRSQLHFMGEITEAQQREVTSKTSGRIPRTLSRAPGPACWLCPHVSEARLASRPAPRDTSQDLSPRCVCWSKTCPWGSCHGGMVSAPQGPRGHCPELQASELSRPAPAEDAALTWTSSGVSSPQP